MSQMDTMVEIKAKVPVITHPTYTPSQRKIAQRWNIALLGELKIRISASHEKIEPMRIAP